MIQSRPAITLSGDMMLHEGYEVSVLDNGYTRFIESWGSDERIVEAARMSTDKGFLGWGLPGGKPRDEKLLAFLWNNQHTSPFEQAGMSIEVQAPIMVFREWHRHRTQSYNEMSARYTQMPNLHYVPSELRVRAQSRTNKQGTSEEKLDSGIVLEFLRRVQAEQRLIYDNYVWALDHGISREVARVNTPISRYSKMRASGNLRNWLLFLSLRTAETAQWEIRQYANVVGNFVACQFPRVYELYAPFIEKYRDFLLALAS